MTQQRKRVLFTTALGAIVVPLVVASFAYACTSLATLSVTPAEGTVGTTITGTGKNFIPHGADRPSTEPVVVRFNSRTGTPLWSGRPDAGGNISFSFTVPDAAPGQHTIIATQNDANGNPASGTPARVAFTVTPSAVQELPIAVA
ncbi:MAG: IPT/TIG domain-containing protein, partial [Acidimicrobiales bacterium]